MRGLIVKRVGPLLTVTLLVAVMTITPAMGSSSRLRTGRNHPKVVLPTAVGEHVSVRLSGQTKWIAGTTVALEQRQSGGWRALVSTRVGKHPPGSFVLHWRTPSRAQGITLRLVLLDNGRIVLTIASGKVMVTEPPRASTGLPSGTGTGPAPATGTPASTTRGEAPTATTLDCTPATLTAGQASTCTVVVDDLGSAPTAPVGQVNLISDATSVSTCAPVSTSSTNASSCQITFTPPQAGTYALSASYSGDVTHAGSQSAAAMLFSQAPPSPAISDARPAPAGPPADGTPEDLAPTDPAPTLQSFSHPVVTDAPPANEIGTIYEHGNVAPSSPASTASPASAADSVLNASSPINCFDNDNTGVPCTPPLHYHGGPVQHHPLIVLIFWGPKWFQDHEGIVGAEMSLFRTLGNQSPTNLAHYYTGILSEYCDSNGCPGTDVSLYQNEAFIDSTAPPYIDNHGDAATNEIDAFDSQYNFTPTADTQYILVLQDGTKIDAPGDCAYHSSSQPFFGPNKEWSIIPDLATWDGGDCVVGSASNPSDVDYAMTRVTSHEFAETVTNGFGNAWYTREPSPYGGQEIGDLCNFIPDNNQILPDSNLWVQYLWDNVSRGGGPGLSNCVRSLTPDPPPGVTASGGANSATVSWQPANNDNGDDITGYGVTAYSASGQNAGTHWLSRSTYSTTFTHLSGGTYHFAVWASDAFGSGAWAISPDVPVGGLSVQPFSTGLTASGLAGNLAGSGVSISHATYSGARVAAGLFSGGAPILGLGSGVVLSSGTAGAVVGPAQVTAISTANGTPGDPQLGAQVGATTYDAAALAFDVVPSGKTVSVTYVFGSSEYDYWANSPYNDVMAIFVDNRNCALLPGGVPVSVNDVNLTRNQGYFRNNDPSYGGGSINTALHGLTTVLRCVAPVTPGQVHHVKIAVADSSDEVLDSDLFVASHSVTSP